MKKLIFFFVCIVCTQMCYGQEIEIGAKGGMNITSLGQSDWGYSPRMTYHIGGYCEFMVSPFLSIQPEMIYSMQGARIDITNCIRLKYQYLNFPLISKIYFYEDASLDLGVQYGFLLKAIEKNDLYTEDIAYLVKKSDFSLVFGVSYYLTDIFSVAVRYNLGISNTADRDIAYEYRLTNKVLQVSAGIAF